MVLRSDDEDDDNGRRHSRILVDRQWDTCELLALRVSEPMKTGCLFFFFLTSATRLQIPFTNPRGFVLGGLIHPRPRMSDRLREKVGIKKFSKVRAPRFPFSLSFFLKREESGGFKGSVSSLIHRFRFRVYLPLDVFNVILYTSNISMELESNPRSSLEVTFRYFHQLEFSRLVEKLRSSMGGRKGRGLEKKLIGGKYPYFAVRE